MGEIIRRKLWQPSSPVIITRRNFLTGAAALAAYAALGSKPAKALTVVSKNIGSNYPTGRDFPDPQTWLTAMNALYPNLVTSGVALVGNCYNDSEFTYSGSPGINFTGFTTDSTHTITLQAASGQGINSVGSGLSPAYYDQANGVAIRQTTNYNDLIDIGDSYVYLIGLQLKGPTHGGNVINCGSQTVYIEQCIVVGSGDNQTIYQFGGGVISQSLLVSLGDGTDEILHAPFANPIIVGCTFVAPSDAANKPANAMNNPGGSSSTTWLDNAVFNCTAISSNAFTGTVSNTATDLGSAPGSSNQTSLTFANQFVDVLTAAQDYSLKTGNSLAGNGVANGTYNATDLAGVTRASPPAIGAREGAAAATAKTHFLNLMGVGQ